MAVAGIYLFHLCDDEKRKDFGSDAVGKQTILATLGTKRIDKWELLPPKLHLLIGQPRVASSFLSQLQGKECNSVCEANKVVIDGIK